jgi:hypothetical protein
MFLFTLLGRACGNVFTLIVLAAIVLTILAGCASPQRTETGAMACHGEVFGFTSPPSSLSTASVAP